MRGALLLSIYRSLKYISVIGGHNAKQQQAGPVRPTMLMATKQSQEIPRHSFHSLASKAEVSARWAQHVVAASGGNIEAGLPTTVVAAGSAPVGIVGQQTGGGSGGLAAWRDPAMRRG